MTQERIRLSAFTVIWEPWCPRCADWLPPVSVDVRHTITVGNTQCPRCLWVIDSTPLGQAIQAFWWPAEELSWKVIQQETLIDEGGSADDAGTARILPAGI